MLWTGTDVPKEVVHGGTNLFTLPSINEVGIVCEAHITNSCTQLTVNRRCADWNFMRPFLVTGTNNGLILTYNELCRIIERFLVL